MTLTQRWTIEEVAALPRAEGTRYELIAGELHVAHQPHWHHQATCDNIIAALNNWGRPLGMGRALQAPGIIYAGAADAGGADVGDEAVAPDIVWIRQERLSHLLDPADGRLRASPDLVVEVLSPGVADVDNEQRNCYVKLDLYGRRGVQEYWIADWRNASLEIYRREDDRLQAVQMLCQVGPLRAAWGARILDRRLAQRIAGDLPARGR